MSTSRLIRVTNEYKARLLALESTALQSLQMAHTHTLSIIQPRLDALYQQIEDAQQGGHFSPSWLYERDRLESIKQLITHEIDQYAALARMQAGQLQQRAADLGTSGAQAQFKALLPAGVHWSFGLPDMKAIAQLIGATQKGSPLADLFNGFGTEAATAVAHALTTGLTLGQNPRKTSRAVADALDISRQRALVISRQETLRAYRGAQSENYQANDDVLDGWIWQSALQARTCAACIAMNGTKHTIDEQMESHVCCRCVQIPITKSWDTILGKYGIDTSNIPDTRVQVQSGADWFEQQSEATQRQILGNAKYDAWSAGAFDFADIVGHAHDDDWGNSIFERPLKALVS